MTIDRKYFELIQAEIDGEIDDAGKKELETFLAESEEGRAVYEELETLCRSLDGIREVDPPPYLKHVVMNMAPVTTAPCPRRRARAGGGRASKLGLQSRAAELALVESSQVNRGAFDDVTGLVGTIAESEFDAPEHSAVSIDKSEVAGKVTLRSTGELLIVDFDLSTKEPVEILAGYSDRSIWFNGFAQLESSGTSVAALY